MNPEPWGALIRFRIYWLWVSAPEHRVQEALALRAIDSCFINVPVRYRDAVVFPTSTGKTGARVQGRVRPDSASVSQRNQ